jgi:xylulokinase
LGLSSSHTRGHVVRSILEGIAFEQLFAISNVEKAMGSKLKDLVAIGGGSANDLWCHMMADVTGKKICIPDQTDASALGAGISAAVGAGWYHSSKEAASEMTGRTKDFYPVRKNHQLYKQLFTSYKKIYPQLLAAGKIF